MGGRPLQLLSCKAQLSYKAVVRKEILETPGGFPSLHTKRFGLTEVRDLIQFLRGK
jgi:hypothetical protein